MITVRKGNLTVTITGTDREIAQSLEDLARGQLFSDEAPNLENWEVEQTIGLLKAKQAVHGWQPI